MKKIIIAALAAATFAAPAMANDFTGARVGVVGGYDRVDNREGFVYGVVGGFDAPVASKFTVGVDATFEDATTKGAGVDTSRDLGIDGRVGYTIVPRLQAFGKVGYASTHFQKVNGLRNVSLEGLRYGGGLELALTKHTYASVEYSRTQTEDNVGGRNDALVGVGYRF